MINLNKRATMATLKSFVGKNWEKLFIRCHSSFDGMSDSTRECEDQSFKRVQPPQASPPNNTLGIRGAWFVGNGGDRIKPFRDNGFEGYRVDNCCGSFSLGVEVIP